MVKSYYSAWVLGLMSVMFSLPVAASGSSLTNLHSTDSPLGVVAIVIFIVAYGLVIAEEFIHLRKSKPVLLAAGVIWVLVALLGKQVEHGNEIVEAALNHNLLEYSAFECLWGIYSI